MGAVRASCRHPLFNPLQIAAAPVSRERVRLHRRLDDRPLRADGEKGVRRGAPVETHIVLARSWKTGTAP
jgi:hypothetical protein